mmetsp:Transcript_107638/g.321933  ORF Transcript_107638/g.321933 Transcript_107638/m.321933 type:complete len:291 (-) Transcript_107638:260-1132(-)
MLFLGEEHHRNLVLRCRPALVFAQCGEDLFSHHRCVHRGPAPLVQRLLGGSVLPRGDAGAVGACHSEERVCPLRRVACLREEAGPLLGTLCRLVIILLRDVYVGDRQGCDPLPDLVPRLARQRHGLGRCLPCVLERPASHAGRGPRLRRSCLLELGALLLQEAHGLLGCCGRLAVLLGAADGQARLGAQEQRGGLSGGALHLLEDGLCGVRNARSLLRNDHCHGLDEAAQRGDFDFLVPQLLRQGARVAGRLLCVGCLPLGEVNGCLLIQRDRLAPLVLGRTELGQHVLG